MIEVIVIYRDVRNDRIRTIDDHQCDTVVYPDLEAAREAIDLEAACQPWQIVELDI